MDFIRTDIDRELDGSSLTPNQQVFEKMLSGNILSDDEEQENRIPLSLLKSTALYLGEIVRLIIVDLVQRSILFPGRMQKSPSIRPDYNIFLILRGKTINGYLKFSIDLSIDVFVFRKLLCQTCC